MKKVSVGLSCVIMAVCLLAVSPVWADMRSIQFREDVGKAYAEYRKALLFSNQHDKQKALAAARQLQHRWSGIVVKYSDQRPCVYDEEPDWKATLNKVGDIIGKGIKQLEDGHLAEAHETIEVIRTELAELRQRNNIISFSDYIDRYHEQMEHLLVKKYTVEKLNKSVIADVREMLAVLEYLMGNIKRYAPEEYSSNDEFQKLLSDNLNVLIAIRQALSQDDSKSLIEAIKSLKPAYAKLFVKFG